LNILTEKLKEVLLSILPIFLSVLVVAVFFVDFSTTQLVLFGINTILLIFGLVLFLLGVDLAIIPFGKVLGPIISKHNKILILVFGAVLLGFIISFAEPSLLVTANQIASYSNNQVSSFLLITIVSLGIACMVAIALLRIVFSLSLKIILTILYSIVFGLSLFVSPSMLAFSFDLSAVTTGVLSVPFLLALSLGITSKQKDSRKSNEFSFGFLAIASVGAIISMLLLGIIKQPEFSVTSLDTVNVSNSVLLTMLSWIIPSLSDALISVLPLFILFLVMIRFNSKLFKKNKRRVIFGFMYALIGLFLFLLSVNASYISIGHTIGMTLIMEYHYGWIILFGFILGVVSILAEPGVYVLTHQIENVTAGYINRKLVLYTLAFGVGLAISLSLIRVLIPTLQLWHLLLPGYFISLVLMWFIDPIFVGMAFDSGGVATGPITATFILAFVNGAAQNIETADLLVDGFGMIAMVALIPILSLQLLGGIYKVMDRRNVRYHG